MLPLSGGDGGFGGRVVLVAFLGGDELIAIEQRDHVFIAGHQLGEVPAGVAVEKAKAEEVHVNEAPQRPGGQARRGQR